MSKIPDENVHGPGEVDLGLTMSYFREPGNTNKHQQNASAKDRVFLNMSQGQE